MRKSTAPTALLCMPPGQGRSAVRAALMAMNVVPQDILPSRTELAQLAHTLQTQPNTAAIIDLDGVQQAAPHIVALTAVLPLAEVRQRVALVRSDHGLWPSDRAWARQLGYADLYGQLDAISLTAESRALLDGIARLTGAEPIGNEALARYFSAMQIKPDTSSPRGLIRKATGLTAEALCGALASSVKALDRVYHLKSYPQCFVGTEAVAWLAKQYALARSEAVKLGGALQALGMLHHVAHEHAFADEAFFYRTGTSTAAARLNLGLISQQLSAKAGVAVKDRLYHGTSYPACFVGSEAVDWLSTSQRLKRHQAEIVLNRLHRLNLIEHVTQEHAVRDGFFFYRFVA